MRYTHWYRVAYEGRPRLDTVSESEAISYARALWAREADKTKEPPTVDEYAR